MVAPGTAICSVGGGEEAIVDMDEILTTQKGVENYLQSPIVNTKHTHTMPGFIYRVSSLYSSL
jgi:hypothetical protein